MTEQNKKVTWEDIMPEYKKDYNFEEPKTCACEYHIVPLSYQEQISKLHQAEREGKVCLNPPTEEELHKLWYDVTGIEISLSIAKGLKAIYKRLRG